MSNKTSQIIILMVLLAVCLALVSCGTGKNSNSKEASQVAVDDDSSVTDDSATDDATDDDTASDDSSGDDTADDTSDDSFDDDTGDDSSDDDTADDTSDDTSDDDTADDTLDDSADDSADDTTDDTAEEPFVYGIKVDNMPLADVIPALDLFAEKGVIMSLNIRPPNLEGDDLANLLAAAKAAGVPVKAWPLLNSSDGSWGCEDDADLFIANVLATMELVAGVDNNVQTVVLNMELGHPKMDLLKQYFDQGDWASIISLLMGNRDLALFAVNTEKFRGLVDDLHGMGYDVQAGTYPFFLDDFLDGDPDIQDISDVPLSGLDWDYFSAAPYTTEYSHDLGMVLGPYFVYSYAKSVREQFGPAGEIAMGIVPTATEDGYASIDDFKADIAAAKAGGVRRMDVYHLPGILAQDDPEAWFDAFQTPPAQPPTEPLVDVVRAGIRLVDAILDNVP